MGRKRKERGYEKERGKEKGVKSLILLIDNALPRSPSPSFWEDDLVFYFSKITTISKKSSVLHFAYLHSLTLLLSFLEEDVFSFSRLVSVLLPSISSLSASL